MPVAYGKEVGCTYIENECTVKKESVFTVVLAWTRSVVILPQKTPFEEREGE